MASNEKLIRIIIQARDEFSAQMEKAANSAQGMAGKLNSVGTSMRNVGIGMTAGITAPLVAFGAAATSAFVEFDGTMAEISARTGAVGEDLETMRNLAKRMGADTKFSATDAAGALLELTASGSSAAEAMEQLKPVLDLAAAGGISMKVAADGVTDALAQFGLEADMAAWAVDTFAVAAGSSSASVNDIMQALGNVGPVAAQFGLDMNDTAAALAVFAENGIKGAEAGTQLRSMLLNMTRQGDNVSSAWDMLGTNIYDAEGNMRDLDTVIKEINVGLRGLSDADANRALTSIFGSYGIVGANALLASNGTLAMKQSFEQAASAADVAAARSATLGGALTSLRGSVETLMITLMESSDGAFINIVNGLISATNAVTNFVATYPRITQFAIVLGSVAAAIGPILIVVGQLIASITTIATALPAIQAGFVAIGAAIGAVSLPVLALVAALAALAIMLAKFGPQAWTAFKQLGQIIAASLAEGTRAIIGFIAKITGLDKLFKTVGEKFKELGVLILKSLVKAIVDNQGNLIKALFDMARQAARAVRDALKIRSPSKVMMEIGQQTVAGFQGGMEGGMTIPSPTLPTAQPALAGIGGGGIYINNLNVPPGTTREQVDAILQELGRRTQQRGARGTR